MKIITSLILTTFALSLSFTGWAQSLHEANLNESSLQEVVEYAQENLSLEGTLLKKPGGYIYLKVDKDYIDVLYPLLGLEEKNFLKPKTSAHIGVFFKEEFMQHYPNLLVEQEIGQTFHFTLERIAIQRVGNHLHAVLIVQSPELTALRSKYGLTPVYYFISLAKRYY